MATRRDHATTGIVLVVTYKQVQFLT